MKHLLIAFFAFWTLGAVAQAPQGLNYQAVARDADGQPWQDTTLDVQFTILQDAPDGTPLYTETHTAVTNAFGLFTLTIGQGATTGVFSNIPWRDGLKFLEVTIDGQLSGTTQLWSVPYALFAESTLDWERMGNNALFTDKQVGIGAPPQDVQLEVYRNFSGLQNASLAYFQMDDTGIDNSLFLLKKGNSGGQDDIAMMECIANENSIFRLMGNGRLGIGQDDNAPFRDLQIGSDFDGIGFEADHGAPNAGALRFGDNTGWRFHIGRSRDAPGGVLNSGSEGALVTFTDNGLVGIGGIPEYPLDIFPTPQFGSPIIRAKIGGSGLALFGVNNQTGAGFCQLHGGGGEWINLGDRDGLTSGMQPTIQLIGTSPPSSLPAIKAQMFINASNQGVVQADIKNFAMNHPLEPGKEIWYACIEGPEAAAYERGTAQLIEGEAIITFSEHFQAVSNPQTMTVQVVPLSADSKGLAVVEKTATGFKIKELFAGAGNYQFDWEVKCVRRGYEDYEVVREKRAPAPPVEEGRE